MPSFASLGKVVVTTAGTPVPVGAAVHAAHNLQLQPLPTNTGLIYVGVGGMNKTTFVGVLAVLGKPPATGPMPTWTVTNGRATNGVGVTEVFIDADNSGEGVVGTVVQA